MPRDVHLRFFVDETSLGVGRALAAVRGDVVHPGHRRLPEVPLGTIDPDWMPLVGSRELVVISRDRHIKSKPAELAAYRQHRLRSFWIAGDKDLGNWENLARVVRWWSEIERIIKDRGPGPWFYGLNATTVGEIPLRSVHASRMPRPARAQQASAEPEQLRLPWT